MFLAKGLVSPLFFFSADCSRSATVSPFPFQNKQCGFLLKVARGVLGFSGGVIIAFI